MRKCILMRQYVDMYLGYWYLYKSMAMALQVFLHIIFQDKYQNLYYMYLYMKILYLSIDKYV